LSDIILPDRKEIIEENRKEIERRLKRNPSELEAFCVDEDKLDLILREMSEIGNNFSHEEKIIMKSSYLMGSIAWAQPFCGANKYTGIFMAMIFMRDNGFDLDVSPYDEAELRELLYEVQGDRNTIDSKILEKLFLYNKQRIVKYESK